MGNGLAAGLLLLCDFYAGALQPVSHLKVDALQAAFRDRILGLDSARMTASSSRSNPAKSSPG